MTKRELIESMAPYADDEEVLLDLPFEDIPAPITGIDNDHLIYQHLNEERLMNAEWSAADHGLPATRWEEIKSTNPRVIILKSAE